VLGVGAMSELQPLTGGSKDSKETKVINGNEMLVDDGTWHYVMVFPMVVKNDKGEEQPGPDGKWSDAKSGDVVAQAKKLFRQRVWDGENVKSKFKPGMTNLQFHDTVRSEIARILSSNRCGLRLETELSVDEDELLLKIELKDAETIKGFADRQEIRMQVKPEKYPDVDDDGKPVDPGVKGVEQGCPTKKMSKGKFLPRGPDNPAVPLYSRYSKDNKDLYVEFREVELIRMVRRRMREFFSLQDLEKSKVVTQMFPVHHYAQKKKFEDMNWAKLSLLHGCSSQGVKT
jgi:hypothetical protein